VCECLACADYEHLMLVSLVRAAVGTADDLETTRQPEDREIREKALRRRRIAQLDFDG
jgi:hypothetical protein